MAAINDPSEAAAGRELVSTRVFEAPRELLFQAFTDPNHLAQWWGPKGFTNTFHEFDPRPGGLWRFVMHGPDSTDYQNHSVFVEVTKPKRIVFDHISGHKFRMTHTFEKLGGKTRLTWQMLFESVAGRDRVKVFVPECNEQNFDRLAAQLAKMEVTHQ